MERVTEEEVMAGKEQARAYAGADFEDAHSLAIELYSVRFPVASIKGRILDLGCGPGDITFRFARLFPGTAITAVDGSLEMIELANARKARQGGPGSNITFIRSLIPQDALPEERYSLIISTSFLHHLHDPSALWGTVKRYAEKGAAIFVYDLLRPASRDEARRLVDKYASGEPDILRADFYNSLLAAFEPGEVTEQLKEAGLTGLSVGVVSDRHMIISGRVG